MSEIKTIAHAGRLKISAAIVRRELFDGRQHIVLPAVMAVVGVLNGALLSQDELGASVDSWNGRPVVIYHPELNGQPVSVSASPKMFEQRVGFIFNTRMDGPKLVSELWIDPDRAERLGFKDLIVRLEKNELVEEVSTGYLADMQQAVGEFNGAQYTATHHNLRPDHFAILPGQEGACSVADGCGVPRINSCGCDRCKAKAEQTPVVLVSDEEQAVDDALSLLAVMAAIDASQQTFSQNRRF